MKALLKSETIQLLTTRTAAWWAIIVFALTFIPTFFALLFLDAALINLGTLLRELSGFSLLVLLFSIVAVTGSYRHKVAVTEQLISPKIWPVMVSKLIIFGICGALVAVLQTAIMIALVAIWPNATLGIGIEELRVIGLSALGVAFSAMLGVVFARIVRSQIAAVLYAIAYFLLIEPSFVSNIFRMKPALHQKIASFLPGQSLENIMGRGDYTTLYASAVLAAWVLLLAGLAYALDKKRDWK